MKRSLTATIVGAGLALAAGGVHAQDAKMAEAKAKEAGCLGCHAVGSAKVGPSFRDVAKKFRKQGDKISRRREGGTRTMQMRLRA